MSKTRREQVDRFWAILPPNINAYSRMIDALLRVLTDEQLDRFMQVIDSENDDDE